jgi:hypothetical protein
MENVQRSASIARKIAIMTLIGFVAIVLSGPIIAAVAAILPFAIVGALIYLLIKAVLVGPFVVGKVIGQTFRGIFFVLIGLPVRLLGKAGNAFLFVVHVVWSTLAFGLSIVFPVVVGGILGGALGLIGGIEHNDVDMRIPAGILIGAGVGLVAAFTLRGKRQSNPIPLHAAAPQTVLPA